MHSTIQNGEKNNRKSVVHKVSGWTPSSMKVIAVVENEPAPEGSHLTWASPTAEGWGPSADSL